MKPYERRATQAYPYYRLAIWSERGLCWSEIRGSYPSEEGARAGAQRLGAGLYRISEIDADGRLDREPFTVG